MHAMRGWTMAAGLLAILAASGCVDDEHAGYADEPDRPQARVVRPAPARPMTATDSTAVRARAAAESVAVERAFRRVRRLRAREVAELRQDRNAKQVATAERLGARVSGEAEIQRLVREGRLVALDDSTGHWVLRDMDHSTPYVTPDAHAMLVEIGRRFHARLDRLGLPRYRFKVTSALRTDETQADLRKTNSYASRTTSSHEFGTTVDVSHERFAVPAPPAGDTRAPEAREIEEEMLEEMGKVNAKALQAELGRVILEMRSQGALHVMMENKQPVYHMTVARRFAGPGESR